MNHAIRRCLFAGALSIGLVNGAVAQVAPPKELVNAGKITYGVAATFAPFEFQKDGKLTGFDVDMIGLLSKKLGAEPKALVMWASCAGCSSCVRGTNSSPSKRSSPRARQRA